MVLISQLFVSCLNDLLTFSDGANEQLSNKVATLVSWLTIASCTAYFLLLHCPIILESINFFVLFDFGFQLGRFLENLGRYFLPLLSALGYLFLCVSFHFSFPLVSQKYTSSQASAAYLLWLRWVSKRELWPCKCNNL